MQALAWRVALLFFGLMAIPDLPHVGSLLRPTWQALGVWLNAMLGRPPFEAFTNGSGDTTFDFVMAAACAAVALAGGALWWALDRRRAHEAAGHEALRLLLRATVAIAMLEYGFAKLFAAQMSAPELDLLARDVGELTPMALLWTFMGHSAAYQAFTGAAEVAGGLLLMSRRTTTLGALLVAGVMANVVMLNMCYDVPVKLYSSRLLAGTLVLLAPDARRLADLLWFNRPVAAADLVPPFWAWPRVRVAAKLALFLPIAATQVGHSLMYGADRLWRRPVHGPLEGIYDVVRQPGPAGPPAAPRVPRLRFLVMNDRGGAIFRPVDGPHRAYWASVDVAAGLVLLKDNQDHFVGRLAFRRPAPDRLVLAGPLAGEYLEAELARRPDDRLELVRRGFHLVNEHPYWR